MALYITGSLAYDRIMTFPGHFSESILPQHLDRLNVSFFIDTLDEKLGGNAGNIAYSLHMLQENPIIVSSAGKDFAKYQSVLERLGLPCEGITIKQDQLTASAYITTDLENRQITAFHAAALMSPSSYTFPNISAENDFALVGPTNPVDMIEHPLLFKKHGVRYIFDPAQQLPVLPASHLRSAIEGAYLLIGNDYEVKLIMELTGLNQEELTAMTKAGLIVTYGSKGSCVFEKGKEPVSIPAVSISKVQDPTGAGDSYRSGLIKGIVSGTTLPEAASLGATCAAYCIEHKGTQTHRFTQEAFKTRYEGTFGSHSFPISS